MRALVVSRLSKVTEATTSPERQRAAGCTLCDQRGWNVVGYADDLDVSGSTDPFRRRELGPWLARPDDFDVLVVYRLDRLTRSLRDLTALMDWAEEHGISIVSATEPFDTSTDLGAMVPKITAMVAELELSAISTRNAGAFETNITAGRYRGGVCPFGYRPVRTDGEWRLEPHADHSRLIREMTEDLISGGSVRSWVVRLNSDAIPTPKDQHALDTGKETKGYRWSVSNLIRSLQSPTLLGYAMRSQPERTKSGNVKRVRDKSGRRRTVYGPKEVIRKPDGEPLVRSEPILTLSQFQKLQDVLASRRGTTPQRSDNATLLLGVLLCGKCGRKMYRLAKTNGRAPAYRCSAVQYGFQCDNGTIQCQWADPIVTNMVLALVGSLPYANREFIPGDDVSAELEEVDAELTAKLALVGSPAYRSGAPKEALNASMAALGARREALEARESRPSGYRYVPTGETFREHFDHLDDAEKNSFLVRHEITVEFTSADLGKKHRPRVTEPIADEGWHITFGDVPDLLEAILPGIDVEEARTDQAAFEDLLRKIGVGVDNPAVERP